MSQVSTNMSPQTLPDRSSSTTKSLEQTDVGVLGVVLVVVVVGGFGVGVTEHVEI